ncbi:MAG: hypothetical protein IPO81_24840 [Kouleothrix sp.]|nr:hypothetical protein [Kouleothrix sp.]
MLNQSLAEFGPPAAQRRGLAGALAAGCNFQAAGVDENEAGARILPCVGAAAASRGLMAG